MDTENIVFAVCFGINLLALIWHCFGIYKYNTKWKQEYLRGFDEGCKWYEEEIKRLIKLDI